MAQWAEMHLALGVLWSNPRPLTKSPDSQWRRWPPTILPSTTLPLKRDFLLHPLILMESSLAKHQVLSQAHPFVLQGEQSWGWGTSASFRAFPALGVHSGVGRGSLRALC